MENEYEGERLGMIDKFNVRTDLALEEKERFESDDVEISGVVLEEHYDEQKEIRITMVKIETEKGARTMGKPVGNYLTLEAPGMADDNEEIHRDISDELEKLLRRILKDHKGKQESVLVVGLGNRMVTPDALGPFVLDDVQVNRHIKEYFHDLMTGSRTLCAVAPGVMGQTGMESREILGGIIHEVQPCCLLVVDSLAAASVHRLCTTIQITDAGICPGAGIGNNRNAINEKELGIPVIAIGVPTVVDASTIVSECMENTLLKEGYTLEQIDLFQKSFAGEMIGQLFVTPKDIDEQIREIGKLVARGINAFIDA